MRPATWPFCSPLPGGVYQSRGRYVVTQYWPGPASRAALAGLCDTMTDVVMRAYDHLSGGPVDMSIIESRRTVAQQKKNIAKGVSWTMDSDHLREHPDGSGVLAVDVFPWIPGEGTSHAPEHYTALAMAMYRAAQEREAWIGWGGHWSTPDKPHYWLKS